MDYRIYLSTTCASSDHLPDAVRELAGFGFRGIELSGHLKAYPAFESDAAAFQQEGLRLLAHHYCPPPAEPFVLNIASPDPDIARRSRAVLARARDFNRVIGGSFSAVHGGHTVDMKPQMRDRHFIVERSSLRTMADGRKIFYDNLERMMAEIFNGTDRIAVENLATKSREENYSLLSDPEQIMDYLNFSRRFDNLGLLLDLGHLQVAAGNLDFDGPDLARRIISEFPDKVYGLHLSDNNGSFDDHLVHGPASWQWGVLEEFAGELAGRPAVFEWSRQANSRERFEMGLEMLKEKFGTEACCR